MNRYEKALDELSSCAMKKTYDYDYDDNLIVDYEYLEDEELNEFVKPLQELIEKCEQYEKALDKACEQLEELEYYYSLVDHDYGDYQMNKTGKFNKSKDEWKELLLKEVQEDEIES